MKYIIPMLIGGLIGYFTNWLAIKMLFRPYEEKFILGFKVPFTPGLIPKEQARIAKSIGMTVEDYLLSPEAIIKSINSKNIEKKVKNNIEEKINILKEESINIKYVLRTLDIEYSEKLINEVSEKIIQNIYNNKESLNKYIYDVLKDKEIYEDIEGVLNYLIDNLLNDGVIDKVISDKIENIIKDNKKLEEILTYDNKEKIFKYLDENQRLIGYRLRELVLSNDVREKMQRIISNMVEANVSSLITAFIPMETISEKIYDAIERYIKSDKVSEDLNGLIKSFINTVLDNKVIDLWNDFFKEVDINDVKIKISKIIQNNIKTQNIISIIINEYKDLDKEKLSYKLTEFIYDKFDDNKFNLLLRKIIKNIYSKVELIEIYDILNFLNLNVDNIYSKIKVIFNENIEDKLPELIASLGISKIVEDTINEFEYDFVEKLILDIANTELKAITKLGGVLGAVIGLITPFLQTI